MFLTCCPATLCITCLFSLFFKIILLFLISNCFFFFFSTFCYASLHIFCMEDKMAAHHSRWGCLIDFCDEQTMFLSTCYCDLTLGEEKKKPNQETLIKETWFIFRKLNISCCQMISVGQMRSCVADFWDITMLHYWESGSLFVTSNYFTALAKPHRVIWNWSFTWCVSTVTALSFLFPPQWIFSSRKQTGKRRRGEKKQEKGPF